MMAESDCDACPGGYYCETDGLTAPTGLCGEGKNRVEVFMNVFSIDLEMRLHNKLMVQSLTFIG